MSAKFNKRRNAMAAEIQNTLFAKRRINPKTGCWDWIGGGGSSSGKYGSIRIGKSRHLVREAVATFLAKHANV